MKLSESINHFIEQNWDGLSLDKTIQLSSIMSEAAQLEDKVELMEAVIFEHNELLDIFRRKLDELEQETLPAAHYQIKRAIAQLNEFMDITIAPSLIESVKAQLEAYLKGD